MRDVEIAARLQMVRELRDGAERLSSCARGERPVEDAMQELKQLRGVIDLLELEYARTTAEFAATDAYDEHGYCSPLQWIRNECHDSSRVAGSALVVGEQEARLGESVTAMREGRIGFAHLALMASTAEHIASTTKGDFDEAPLLRKALQHTVTRFRRDCAHARHRADAHAFLLEHRDAVEERFLEVSVRDDGCVWLRGFLDSVGGSSVRSLLEPLAKPDGKDDHRTRDRRLADALVEVSERCLADASMTFGTRRPAQVQVTVSLDALRGFPADAAELELAGPVPAATAQRLACDGSVSRILLDADSNVLDVGRSRRVPAPATRRALQQRDRGCVWPGCDRPASWTDAHHVVHWAHDGPTDIEKLALVCGRHHWKLHEGGWQMARDAEGVVHTIPPLPGYTRAQARAPDGAVA